MTQVHFFLAKADMEMWFGRPVGMCGMAAAAGTPMEMQGWASPEASAVSSKRPWKISPPWFSRRWRPA